MHLFLLGGLEGRSALQLRASGSSLRSSNGHSVLVFLRFTEITGITSCYVLLCLETLVHLASLLRRTGKCSKTYREVRFFVPGSASGRTGKCSIAYREVRFQKSDTQPACGRLYREVLWTQSRWSVVYREVLFQSVGGTTKRRVPCFSIKNCIPFRDGPTQRPAGSASACIWGQSTLSAAIASANR